jgi:hypothetical protein
VAVSEASYLLDCWRRTICAYCGQRYLATQRVGSGQKSKGGFCSLDCYTKYYQLEIVERLRRARMGSEDR